jgi:hypothetical protein
MGVGVQFSAPYAHHMLGKAERPWRTIRDNAFAMLDSMAVPNFMWSCVVITVVYMRNRNDGRLVGLTGGVPLTLLTSSTPDASKFWVFGCTVFAKVPDKLRRKLREKAFWGVMVGYPPNAPDYRIYNPETRRITTSVHVVFHENTRGFGARLPVDSVIADAFNVDDPHDLLTSHPIDPLPPPSSRSPTLTRLLMPTAHPVSALTPSATATSSPTWPNTHQYVSHHVVTLNKARPRRTSSISPSCPIWLHADITFRRVQRLPPSLSSPPATVWNQKPTAPLPPAPNPHIGKPPCNMSTEI